MKKAPVQKARRGQKKGGRRAKSGQYQPAPQHVIPWAKVREEYETSDISVSDLCKRYSIASRTSITRVRDKEGWRRDVVAIAASLANDDLIAPHVKKQAQEAAAAAGEILPPEYAEPVPPEQAHYGAPGETKRAQARALAKIQRDQVRDEQDVAGLGMLVSAKVLRHLDTILSDDDQSKVQDAADRLSKISDRQESFSSLLRAAMGSFKDAVTLRRRAVGLAVPQSPLGTGMLPPQPSEIPDEVARILPRLDIDSLEKLREVSEKLERLRQIEP